jgi:hypothetical protein
VVLFALMDEGPATTLVWTLFVFGWLSCGALFTSEAVSILGSCCNAGKDDRSRALSEEVERDEGGNSGGERESAVDMEVTGFK